MAKSARLIVALAFLALPGTVAAQAGGDSAYCQALSDKYKRYVVGTSGSGKMGSPNISVESASSKCNSDAARSIPVLEKALRDAQIDLPPRS